MQCNMINLEEQSDTGMRYHDILESETNNDYSTLYADIQSQQSLGDLENKELEVFPHHDFDVMSYSTTTSTDTLTTTNGRRITYR